MITLQQIHWIGDGVAFTVNVIAWFWVIRVMKRLALQDRRRNEYVAQAKHAAAALRKGYTDVALTHLKVLGDKMNEEEPRT